MCMYTLFLVLRKGPRSNVPQLTVRAKLGLSNTGIYQEKLTVRSKIGYQFCISKRDNKIKDRTIKYTTQNLLRITFFYFNIFVS